MEEYAKLLPHHHNHPQHSSMTLFSRLDHLDFVMKCLEKKQRIERVGGGSNNSAIGIEKKCVSLDVALKDTYFKGSLMDRVAALEHRLFQLCLEMDSSSSTNVSSLTSTQTSAEISSSSQTPKQFCKGQPSSSSSYPTFHYPPHGGGASQITQVQEKPQTQRHQHKKKQGSPSKVQLGKTRTGKDEVGTCKNVKKGNSPSKWPHLRMFGC